MRHSQSCERPWHSGVLASLAVAMLLAVPGCGGETPPVPAPIGEAPDPSAAVEAAGPPEGTDVWLLDLAHDGDTLRASAPRNLTQRPGYDNQPFFTPSGDLLYVQMEGGRTDVWQWSAGDERVTRVTATPDQGEYSPTPIPGSDGGISYIRSPDDSSGRLWRMPRAGAEPEVVFADIGPVGYHAWFDPDHVALWLLQESRPLQVVDLATNTARPIATDVGRSPQSVPKRRAVSFTRATDSGRQVELYDLDLERTEVLAVLPEGGDFHAWTPDGVLLCSAGSRVYAWRDGSWQTVVDLGDRGLLLTRLAVSPDSQRLALVAEPTNGT